MQRRLLRQQRTARDLAFEPRRLSRALASPVRGWRTTCCSKICGDRSIGVEVEADRFVVVCRSEIEIHVEIQSTLKRPKRESFLADSRPLNQKIAVANTGAHSSLASTGISFRARAQKSPLAIAPKETESGTRLLRIDVFKVRSLNKERNGKGSLLGPRSEVV